MSDLAISAAAALTSGTLATADLFPVLDVSAAASSKGSRIEAAELATWIATRLGLSIASGGSLATVGAFALTLTATATSNATIPAGTNTLIGSAVANTISFAPTAGNPSLKFSGAWTASATAPVVLIEASGATAFSSNSANGVALAINAASGFTGNFLEFHLNNVSLCDIRPNAAAAGGGQYVATFALDSTGGTEVVMEARGGGYKDLLFRDATRTATWLCLGNDGAGGSPPAGRVSLAANVPFGWGGTNNNAQAVIDMILVRGAAATLQLGQTSASTTTNQIIQACGVTSSGTAGSLTLKGGLGVDRLGGAIELGGGVASGAGGLITFKVAATTSYATIFSVASTQIQIADGINLNFDTTTGSKLGTNALEKIGFWGTTPVVQPTAGNQAALTDSTGGTYDGTVQAIGDTTAVDQSTTLNNNFADILGLLNQLRNDLTATGIIKGS